MNVRDVNMGGRAEKRPSKQLCTQPPPNSYVCIRRFTIRISFVLTATLCILPNEGKPERSKTGSRSEPAFPRPPLLILPRPSARPVPQRGEMIDKIALSCLLHSLPGLGSVSGQGDQVLARFQRCKGINGGPIWSHKLPRRPVSQPYSRQYRLRAVGSEEGRGAESEE